ncbi:hypothetical protein AB0M20_10655 [Actinoplanes sp. NPDC051633]|uniref:hypothetical protein n=1 Tax=Actinoplanes sp. NPDC051633 TaxID=3155670 RepID=UPI00341EF07A
MTFSSLIAALAMGAIVGLGGRCLRSADRWVPIWLALAVGIGAAVFGTVVARLAGADGSGVGVAEIALQLAFAGLAVGLVWATADRHPADRHPADSRPADSRHGRPGLPR